MKKCIRSLILLAVVWGFATQAAAQERLPFREHTNPMEQVVLDQRVPFEQALEVIEELSREFDNKMIIDRSGFSGPIGTSIQRLHWRDALAQIAQRNELVVMEYDRFFEIRSAEEEEEEERERRREEEEELITFDTREVEIKATFFYVDRSVSRALGIDWSALEGERFSASGFGANRISDENLNIELNLDDVGGSGWDINALFNTLEDNNYGEILASPTIKVMDGETGRIQVGQDFSIRERTYAGNIIDRFYSAGTILEVTPRILQHEGVPFIYMEVDAERSDAVPGTITTIVTKQEAQTNLLMLSGESTVIGGLYETEENITRSGIPILKDLPKWFFGLRYVFGYERKEYEVKELVILLEVNLVPSLQERLDGIYRSRQELLREFREEQHLEHSGSRDIIRPQED
ncbi:type II and III secretion system protein [Balneolaceae bacterium ANBcel3]|nr:type II and III secretion system protein [Balneolaceae bacterium ANBcel3]